MSDEPQLTVVTFLWRGWRPGVYRAEHVNALQAMVRDHLTIPHRFLCICDRAHGIKTPTLPLWRQGHVRRPPEQMNSYRRLRLFARDMPELIGTPWILQLDLDTLIVDNIDPLITWDDLKLVKGTMAPYNGSMWLHRLGSRPHLWEQFNPRHSPREVAAYGQDERRAHKKEKRPGKAQPYRGSDQAWIGYMSPHEPVWGEGDGVYRVGKKRRRQRIPQDARILFFPGQPKPWSPHRAKFARDVVERYRQYLVRG